MKSIIAIPNGLGEATHKFQIYLNQKPADNDVQHTAPSLGFISYNFYEQEYMYRPENGNFIPDKNLADIVEIINHYFSIESLLYRPQYKIYLN
jgi:hypothetical protein